MADQPTMSEAQEERAQVLEDNRQDDVKVPDQAKDDSARSDAETEGDDAATTGAGTGARAGEYS